MATAFTLSLGGLPFAAEPTPGAAVQVVESEAPNPVLPDVAELIWGGLAFLVVLVVMLTKGVPAIQKGMQARADTIQGDLAAAEQAKVEQQAITADLTKQKADARSEYDRVIATARADAEKVKADLMANAQAEVNEMKTKATADIEAARAQALASIQGSIGGLVVELAEKVVERNLDRDANTRLVDSFISKVGS